MKRLFLQATIVLSLSGCATPDPAIERGPYGTVAYDVPIESSEPGIRIEVNGVSIGSTPLVLKIFGDQDGTFHNFGSPDFLIVGRKLNDDSLAQTKFFHTGSLGEKDDKIPDRIYFDFESKSN